MAHHARSRAETNVETAGIPREQRRVPRAQTIFPLPSMINTQFMRQIGATQRFDQRTARLRQQHVCNMQCLIIEPVAAQISCQRPIRHIERHVAQPVECLKQSRDQGAPGNRQRIERTCRTAIAPAQTSIPVNRDGFDARSSGKRMSCGMFAVDELFRWRASSA